MKKLIQKYFKSFSKKELNTLNDMFSNNIELIDWTTQIKTKKNVLKFNQKIFKKFKKISVKLHEIFYNKNNKSASCKITVVLNSKKINVIDLIYFNKNNKIKKIVAYLR